MGYRIQLLLFLAVAGLAIGAAAAIAPAPVDYDRQVRALLASRCYACHGATVRKHGLRLDLRVPALDGGDSGPAILPGKGTDSELIRRVTSHDPKKVMPPAGKPLSAEEVELLRSWIDQGAPWPDEEKGKAGERSRHWSFQPVRRLALPPVKRKSWVINPIDTFILAKLEERGLRPSRPADRVTLIRRLSLDLLGLPPSVEEVDAFVNDGAPGAYERAVDHLLASPHYGERWGRLWLDGARYADSNGYTIDSARSIWKYRDWVIDALNRDLPFDQFAIEQIAGDMLPNATEGQVVATGFHRNTLINEEGGTDQEQFRVESVVDRVNTTGSVFLGLTVGCAQCHTHKFDPITQKEYYQLYAFFNNADEPNLPFPTPEQARSLEEAKRRIAAAKERVADFDRNRPRNQEAWEERARRQDRLPWTALDLLNIRSQNGAALTKLEDHSILVGGTIPNDDVYLVSAEVPAGTTALRLEVLTHESLPRRGPGFANGNFVLTEFEVRSGESTLPLASAVADHSQKDYPISLAIDGQPKTGWAINVATGEGSLNSDRAAVFVLKEPVRNAGRITILLRQEHPNRRYQIGRFRLSASTSPAEEHEFVVPAAVRPILEKPAGARTAAETTLVAAAFRKSDPARARLETDEAVLQDRLKDMEKSVVTTMVMKERQTPRESFIQIRGDFLRRGARATPNVPAVLPPLPPEVRNPNRLDLARWLVDPRNPLTPRVTVNRIWQQHFGIGLVETDSDFGTQGTPPSHPELLDWLASYFVTGVGPEAPNAQRPTPNAQRPTPNAWSLKALHRLIVTSATYRQSSRVRPELREIDPQNRLLARQSRLRLDAEVVRDVALAASGLLSRKIGGPSVFPPQPSGLDAFTQNKKNWKPSEGEDRFRRGMYTFFWRSSPYAMFTTFDAPNAQLTCTRRLRSNTPLQALMLANDQSIVEMAQGLAERLLREAPSDDERLHLAFRRCFARAPSAQETNRLLGYYRSQALAFAASPQDAGAVAPRVLPEATTPAEGAAWTAVARVLLNLDELITRE